MAILNAKARARADVPTPAAGYAALFFDLDNANVPTIKLPDASFQPLESGPPGPDGTPGHFGIDFAGDWVAGAYAQYKIVNHRGSSWSASRATFAGEEPGVNPADAVLGGNTAVADVASGDADTQQQFTVTQPITVTVVSVDAFGLDIPAATTVELRTDAGVVLGSGVTPGITLAGTPALVALATPTPLVPATTYRLYVNSDNAGVRTGAATPAGDVATVGNLYLAGVLTAGKNLRFSLTGYPTSPWLDLGLGGGSGVATGRTFPVAGPAIVSHDFEGGVLPSWLTESFSAGDQAGAIVTTDAPVGFTKSWRIARPNTDIPSSSFLGATSYLEMPALAGGATPPETRLVKMRIKYQGVGFDNYRRILFIKDEPTDTSGDQGYYGPVYSQINNGVAEDPSLFLTYPGEVDANGWREIAFVAGGGTDVVSFQTVVPDAIYPFLTADEGWMIADIRIYPIADGTVEGELFFERQTERFYAWYATRGWIPQGTFQMNSVDDMSWDYEVIRGNPSTNVFDLDTIQFLDARNIGGRPLTTRPGLVTLEWTGTVTPGAGILHQALDSDGFLSRSDHIIGHMLDTRRGGWLAGGEIWADRAVTFNVTAELPTEFLVNGTDSIPFTLRIFDPDATTSPGNDYASNTSGQNINESVAGYHWHLFDTLVCKLILPDAGYWDDPSPLKVRVKLYFVAGYENI